MKREVGESIRFRLLKCLYALVMVGVFAGFFHYAYLPNYFPALSLRAELLVLAAYIVLFYNFEKTYHALSVGLLRVTELVYSQSLVSVFCAGFIYLALSLYRNGFLSIWPLLLMLLLQFGWSTLWTLLANTLFHRIFPPARAALIYRTASDLSRLESIRYFADHFNVQKTIVNPSDADNILPQLEDVEVVIAAGINADLRNQIAKYCVERNLTGYFVPHLGDIILAGANPMPTFGLPVMQVHRVGVKHKYLALKRFGDLLISLIGILLASPVMLAVAIAIKAQDGGPIFYRQTRLTQKRTTVFHPQIPQYESGC